MADWLSTALKDEAERYEPSRARIEARVMAKRGIQANTSARPKLFITLVAAFCTGVVVFGGPFVAEQIGSSGGSGQVAAIPETESSPSAEPSPSGPPLAATGQLDPHSNPYWAQNNLVVTLNQPVTSLRVTINVARGPGVEVTGAWVGLPAEDFVEMRTALPNAYVFDFTLKEGRKVWAGQWTFAAQYNRTKAHDGTKDTYTVTIPGATVTGRFRPPPPSSSPTAYPSRTPSP